MRVLFLLVLLAGAALGLWPWAVQNFSGSEIGTWIVYREGRFLAAEIGLPGIRRAGAGAGGPYHVETARYPERHGAACDNRNL